MIVRPYRKPDTDLRQAAYTSKPDGTPTRGGPHPDGDVFMPKLWAAAEKVENVFRAQF